MAKFSEKILPQHQAFIEKQRMFFTATAPLNPEGKINLSPKGTDSFKVLNETQVAYADFIGSGNETSAHTRENGRITFMFCAFDGAPNILRLYGKARAVLPGSELWQDLVRHFTIHASTRQIILAEIDAVQTSCGYGVPLFDYVGERDHLFKWAEKKGEQGLKDYVLANNLVGVDGLITDYGAGFDLRKG